MLPPFVYPSNKRGRKGKEGRPHYSPDWETESVLKTTKIGSNLNRLLSSPHFKAGTTTTTWQFICQTSRLPSSSSSSSSLFQPPCNRLPLSNPDASHAVTHILRRCWLQRVNIALCGIRRKTWRCVRPHFICSPGAAARPFMT